MKLNENQKLILYKAFKIINPLRGKKSERERERNN